MDMITSQGLRMPKLGLGTWRMKATSAGRRWSGRSRWATGTSTRPKCMATRRMSAARWRGARLPRRTSTSRRRSGGRTEDGRDAALVETSLRKLQTDYVDLYMIHWPGAGHGPARRAAHADEIEGGEADARDRRLQFPGGAAAAGGGGDRRAAGREPDRIPRPAGPGLGAGVPARARHGADGLLPIAQASWRITRNSA